jgi:hypothetical protein
MTAPELSAIATVDLLNEVIRRVQREEELEPGGERIVAISVAALRRRCEDYDEAVRRHPVGRQRNLVPLRWIIDPRAGPALPGTRPARCAWSGRAATHPHSRHISERRVRAARSCSSHRPRFEPQPREHCVAQTPSPQVKAPNPVPTPPPRNFFPETFATAQVANDIPPLQKKRDE